MPTAAPITSEEYLALPDEFDQWGNRIRDELIHGEVVKYPIHPLSHDLPRNNVAEALIHYLLANENLQLTCADYHRLPGQQVRYVRSRCQHRREQTAWT